MFWNKFLGYKNLTTGENVLYNRSCVCFCGSRLPLKHKIGEIEEDDLCFNKIVLLLRGFAYVPMFCV